MYIRQTKTNNTLLGESYFTHRLVRSERMGAKVRQVTLLNLGRHFSIPQEDWPMLCQRIEEILSGQASFMCESDSLEKAAQRYAMRLIESTPSVEANTEADIASVAQSAKDSSSPDYQEVDINSLQQLKPRSVGVESLGVQALTELGLFVTGFVKPRKYGCRFNFDNKTIHGHTQFATAFNQ